MYDIALNYNKQQGKKLPFHSARFFFYNSIDSVWYSYERIIVYLGLRYGFEFNNHFELNTSVRILDFLKKNKDFKESKHYKLLHEYIAKNKSFIDDTRKYNTHDLSKHIIDLNQRLKKSPEKTMQLINQNDANSYDEKNIKPQISKLIMSINNLYTVLLSILDDFYINFELFKDIKIPMLNEFEGTIDTKYLIKADKKFDLKQIDSYKSNLFFKLVSLNKDRIGNNEFQMLCDIFFRMEDIQKSLIDYYNHENNYLIEMLNTEIEAGIERFLDDKTFLYASLSRVYSILDKLARYISTKYNLINIKYFKDLQSLDNSNCSTFLNKVIDLSNSIEYKLLYNLRNRIAHNLSSGALMGKKVFNMTIIISTIALRI